MPLANFEDFFQNLFSSLDTKRLPVKQKGTLKAKNTNPALRLPARDGKLEYI